MTDIVATNDVYISGASVVWATARTVATAYNDTDAFFQIGSASNYSVARPLLKFDTSVIPAGTLLTCKLRMSYYDRIAGSPDFDIMIVKQDWSAQDPISSGNMNTAYNNTLTADLDDNIWLNTSAAFGTELEGGLMNLAWINRSGFTYYSLIASFDRNNSAPAGEDRYSFRGVGDATAAYRPYLVITYQPSSIKSLLGVELANIKTVETIAIAACGKIAGVDNT